MTPMACRSLLVAFAFTALLGACASEPAAPISSSPEVALRDFEALDADGARAAYLDMGPAERADLWRASYDRQLASGVLSEDQAAVLREMRDHADELVLSKDLATVYRTRLLEVMTLNEVSMYASSLGSHGEGVTVDSSPVGLYNPVPACNRNLECYPCECFGYTCLKQICPACRVTDGGCGPFGWFDCDGMDPLSTGQTCN